MNALENRDNCASDAKFALTGGRLTIELTERGRAAAVAIEAGTRAIDAQLSAMITSAQMSGLRVGLAALAEIKEKTEEDA